MIIIITIKIIITIHNDHNPDASLLREGVSDHLQLLIPTLALDHWIAAARSHYSDDHDDDADEE